VGHRVEKVHPDQGQGTAKTAEGKTAGRKAPILASLKKKTKRSEGTEKKTLKSKGVPKSKKNRFSRQGNCSKEDSRSGS